MTSFQIPVTGTVFCTELGWVSICWNEEKVCQISFGHPNKTQALRRLLCKESPHSHLTPAQKELANRIEDYAAGEVVDFSDVELDFGKSTRFQDRVYHHCRKIPRGQTATYKVLATRAGSPNAARAVGNAMAGNPIPLIVPCHRVVASTGKGLGGFSAPGGQGMKRRLLDLESD